MQWNGLNADHRRECRACRGGPWPASEFAPGLCPELCGECDADTVSIKVCPAPAQLDFAHLVRRTCGTIPIALHAMSPLHSAGVGSCRG